MTEETIRIAAHQFMKGLKLQQIDVQHDNQLVEATVVESFIARKGDDTFIPGAWVVAVHIESDDLWEAVLKGELNGFSMQGVGFKAETTIALEIPEFVEGLTEEVNDHTHQFIVRFDESGNFLGGQTTEVNGHIHLIRKGTSTEKADDHAHRFQFVEVWANVDNIE